MFGSSWLPFVLSWTLYTTNGCQDDSNMNSLEKKWQSRRIKHELSTKEMAVKRNQTWTLYKTNGSQDESNMNSLHNKWLSRRFKHDNHLCRREFMFDSSWLPFLLVRVHVWFVCTTICFVEISCFIRLDCHLCCREFMFDSSWQPVVLKRIHIWFALTAICFVESLCYSSCLWLFLCRDLVCFFLSVICFVMNSLQNKWQSRRIKHELSTKQMAVKTNQTWTLYKTNGSQDESNMNSLQNKWQSRRIKHELSTMFDSSWQPFVL
jgi:hypothetical protein